MNTIDFSPEAIREHFSEMDEDDIPPSCLYLLTADDDTLAAVGRIAIFDESLWDAFQQALINAAELVRPIS